MAKRAKRAKRKTAKAPRKQRGRGFLKRHKRKIAMALMVPLLASKPVIRDATAMNNAAGKLITGLLYGVPAIDDIVGHRARRPS